MISRAGEDSARVLDDEIKKTGLELIGTIPLDSQVADFDLQGRPLFQLPDDSAAVQAVAGIARKMEL